MTEPTKTTNPRSSDSPVPSFTLQITKHDAKRFVDACQSVGSHFEAIAADPSHHNGRLRKPLHEMLYEAASQSHNPLVSSFLERTTALQLSPKEARLCLLVFHDADKTSKLRHFFAEFSNHPGKADLDRSGLVSLFRTVLLSLSFCACRSERRKQIVVEGNPEKDSPANDLDPPIKKVKRDDDTLTTKPLSDDGSPQLSGACPSSSFDSTVVTQAMESDRSETIRQDVQEIAEYAADQVKKFATSIHGAANQAISLATFGEWYNHSGRSIVPWLELLQISKWKHPDRSFQEDSKLKDPPSFESPASLLEETDSKAILSFDFSSVESTKPIILHITEDNIVALRQFVQRSCLVHRQPVDICRMLLSLSPHKKVLTRETFQRNIHRLFPVDSYAALTDVEKNLLRDDVLTYFAAFEGLNESLHQSEVDLRELALGFSFFCGGNKSTKLALGYEILDSGRTGLLTEKQLLIYLQSYLSVLSATSFLLPPSKRRNKVGITEDRKSIMHTAVRRGARWTLRFFLQEAQPFENNSYSFDSFASWYSETGYNIAPWLELLDLNKILPLAPDLSSPLQLPALGDIVGTEMRPLPSRDRVSSLRRHHSSHRRGPSPDVLFTFPLANRRSLVVLKDDAKYVRNIVEQLGLMNVRSEQLWEAISRYIHQRRKPKRPSDGPEYVDMQFFVQCIQETCPKLNRKRANPGEPIQILPSSSGEILANFFQCFDLNQADSVAIDELMGGLSLLCGGKKSQKLAFAFSIFDTRPGVHDKQRSDRVVHSLSGEDLFLFLRSVLITTFSCCRQSLDMNDEIVGRCIADTANMICNDVMRYQWETKQIDRLDFDEFGQWYNDGGFERAPWLELLDLRKWVLLDTSDYLDKKPVARPPPDISVSAALNHSDDVAIPPAPPDDALDGAFFDENAIGPMDSMDEMDMILMQPSIDKDADMGSPKLEKTFSFSPPTNSRTRKGSALKFHLVTSEKHGGYLLSMSSARIDHLRRLMDRSGIHNIEPEVVTNQILKKASRNKICKLAFDSSMRSLIPMLKENSKSRDHRVLSAILSDIFQVFDPNNTGRASAIEVACGLTLLCRGKKSDKLEFAFEVLDRNKRGQLAKEDMTNYLQSFLHVLLAIAISPVLDHDDTDDILSTIKGKACERTTKTIAKAGKAGAEWAASLSFAKFEERSSSTSPFITFDDFASWYTTAGYSSIPWLELLDLRKWVLTP